MTLLHQWSRTDWTYSVVRQPEGYVLVGQWGDRPAIATPVFPHLSTLYTLCLLGSVQCSSEVLDALWPLVQEELRTTNPVWPHNEPTT